MKITPIKTRPFLPPKDDIFDLLDQSINQLQEGDILFITSKVVAIHQGLCEKIEEVPNKDDLIKQEAQYSIDRSKCPGGYVVLTIKDGFLIPTSGIDESNSNGYYVLFPKDSSKIAKEICEYLKQKFKIQNLAVVITDSTSRPLKKGVTGFATGFYGLKPLKSYIGQKDIFGREIKMSQLSIVDSLSSIAVMYMGEGDECTPFLKISNCSKVEFTQEETFKDYQIPLEDDIYYSVLKNFKKNAN